MHIERCKCHEFHGICQYSKWMGEKFIGKKKKIYTFSPLKNNNSWEKSNCFSSDLLKLPGVRDVSTNLDWLKAYLDWFFQVNDWGKLHDLNNFIRIYAERASASTGFTISLFPRIVAEHSHLHFWCFVHQLELTITESVSNGWLNGIKECLQL